MADKRAGQFAKRAERKLADTKRGQADTPESLSELMADRQDGKTVNRLDGRTVNRDLPKKRVEVKIPADLYETLVEYVHQHRPTSHVEVVTDALTLFFEVKGFSCESGPEENR